MRGKGLGPPMLNMLVLYILSIVFPYAMDCTASPMLPLHSSVSPRWLSLMRECSARHNERGAQDV